MPTKAGTERGRPWASRASSAQQTRPRPLRACPTAAADTQHAPRVRDHTCAAEVAENIQGRASTRGVGGTNLDDVEHLLTAAAALSSRTFQCRSVGLRTSRSAGMAPCWRVASLLPAVAPPTAWQRRAPGPSQRESCIRSHRQARARLQPVVARSTRRVEAAAAAPGVGQSPQAQVRCVTLLTAARLLHHGQLRVVQQCHHDRAFLGAGKHPTLIRR